MTNKAKLIYIIDDDSSIGEIISEILELEGYAVNSYKSGKEGVEGCMDKKPDLILLDYFLPGENAENIIHGLRNDDIKLPIILMSASRQAEEHSKSLEVNEFLAKPFQREKLLDTIARHLN